MIRRLSNANGQRSDHRRQCRHRPLEVCQYQGARSKSSRRSCGRRAVGEVVDVLVEQDLYICIHLRNELVMKKGFMLETTD